MKRPDVHLQNVGKQNIHVGKHRVMGEYTDGVVYMGRCLRSSGTRNETIGLFSFGRMAFHKLLPLSRLISCVKRIQPRYKESPP